jgi:8-oxo-dGTP diphosphatase
MKAYYLFGQLLRPFFSVAFYAYNKIAHRPRARVVVWNEDGDVLLVRNWARERQWGLPGGGVGRHETPLQAAQRELQEEIGVSLPAKKFKSVGTFQAQGHPSPIYSVRIMKQQLPEEQYNPWEITHLAWFDPDSLPPLSPLTREVLRLLATQS